MVDDEQQTPAPTWRVVALGLMLLALGLMLMLAALVGERHRSSTDQQLTRADTEGPLDLSTNLKK